MGRRNLEKLPHSSPKAGLEWATRQLLDTWMIRQLRNSLKDVDVRSQKLTVKWSIFPQFQQINFKPVVGLSGGMRRFTFSGEALAALLRPLRGLGVQVHPTPRLTPGATIFCPLRGLA
jgi:hypothetical protein